MNEEFPLFPDHARAFILSNSELPVMTLLLEVLFLHLSCLILTEAAPTPLLRLPVYHGRPTVEASASL